MWYKCFYFYFFPVLMITFNYYAGAPCNRPFIVNTTASVENNFTPEYKQWCVHQPNVAFLQFKSLF